MKNKLAYANFQEWKAKSGNMGLREQFSCRIEEYALSTWGSELNVQQPPFPKTPSFLWNQIEIDLKVQVRNSSA